MLSTTLATPCQPTPKESSFLKPHAKKTSRNKNSSVTGRVKNSKPSSKAQVSTQLEWQFCTPFHVRDVNLKVTRKCEKELLAAMRDLRASSLDYLVIRLPWL